MRTTTAPPSKTTLIKHESNRNSVAPYQITGLALELAKLPDGTIDRVQFASCCDQAFEILTNLMTRLQTNDLNTNSVKTD